MRSAILFSIVTSGCGVFGGAQAPTSDRGSNVTVTAEINPRVPTQSVSTDGGQDPMVDADNDGVPAHEDCDEWQVTRYSEWPITSSTEILNRTGVWTGGAPTSPVALNLDSATISLCPGTYYTTGLVFKDASVRVQARDVPQEGGQTYTPTVIIEPTVGLGFLVAATSRLELHGITITNAPAGALDVDPGGQALLRYSSLEGNGGVTGAGINNASDGSGDIPGVDLVDCTLLGNTARDQGGAVFNSGTLRATRCQLGSLDLPNTAFDGAGIWNSGTIELESCTVEGNVATNRGGGMLNTGTATVIDTNIEANQARYGGGVANESGAGLTASGGTFEANDAESGGALHNQGGAAFLTTVALTANVADPDHGGAIATLDGATLDIVGSTFDANSATRRGGAIAWFDSTERVPAGSVQAEACTFINNVADQGGAIGVQLVEGRTEGDALLELVDTVVDGNSAAYGGGVYLHSSPYQPLDASCASKTGVAAIVGNTATLQGGGVLFSGAAEGTFEADGCDLGATASANDNAPSDVSFYNFFDYDYGEGSAFVCTAGLLRRCQ